MDLLTSTREACREAASRGGRSQDAADVAWLEVHREGLGAPTIGRIQTEAASGQPESDRDTIKFTLSLTDGHETESVILPMTGSTGRMRTTLCLSSQVGCALGCVFCETAAMGFIRNLSTSEILAQWHAARFRLKRRITNIVFMGMGEPMENLDAVLAAIEVLCDRSGAGIAASRICVSTAGRLAGIERYTRFMQQPGFHQVKLAVSVNAPTEAIRRDVMPITRAEPMAALKAAMLNWLEAGGQQLLVEYVLIPGINDSDHHPRLLGDWLSDIDCRVNVIPYNPRRNSPWPAPTDAAVDAFIAGLHAAGCQVNRRRTMGRDVMAACGQLGNPEIRRRVPLRVPDRSFD